MVNVGVLYRYVWQGRPRAMHARLVGDDVTVTHVDPVTCQPTEAAGVYVWTDGALVGDGPLSQTRREGIGLMLLAALDQATE